MSLKQKTCEHLSSIEVHHTIIELVCEDCIKTGDTWVHLRMCVECGHIGCCDSSVNKHASKHFDLSQHPVIISAEKGENWAWCYQDSFFKKL